MDLKQLFNDDRAVSPVIGVILMVAITVILAAVIGTFVLGLGDQIKTTTPTASFETDYTQDASGDNDTLELTHGGGDTIDASALSVTLNGADESTANNDPNGEYNMSTLGVTSDKVSAGTVVNVNRNNINKTGVIFQGTDSLNLNSATARMVWSGESGDNSAVLAKWSGPDA